MIDFWQEEKEGLESDDISDEKEWREWTNMTLADTRVLFPARPLLHVQVGQALPMWHFIHNSEVSLFLYIYKA